jgi:hypothetical protein
VAISVWFAVDIASSGGARCPVGSWCAMRGAPRAPVQGDVLTFNHFEDHRIDSRDTQLGPEEVTRDIRCARGPLGG